VEILIENFSKSAELFAGVLGLSSLLLSFWSHLEFNEDVAVASVVNSCLHSLVESNSNSSEINIGWRDLDSSVTSSSKDLEVVLLEESLRCNFCVVS